MTYSLLIAFNILLLLIPEYKELNCMYTKNSIPIDGQLNEWSSARSILLQDKSHKTDNTAIVRTLWNEQNLYIAFEVQDKNLQAKQTVPDHSQLWLDDMIEFLIDTHNDKDSCWNVDDLIYHINILGQKKDDRGSSDCITNPKWNGNAQYAIKMFGTLNDSTDIDTSYNVEISISWNELAIKPFPGLQMGVDFPDGDHRKGLFDWVGASPFRSPYAFGNLILVKNRL
jgi:hypothetical protein